MGKKGKKAQAGKPKKLTPKDIGKRLNTLAKNLEEELKGADIFKPLPPTDDCAICLVPLSRMATNSVYEPCCGNLICVGCAEENMALIKKQNEKNPGKKVAFTCPFCRELPPSSDDEHVRQIEARALKNDHIALIDLGVSFSKGEFGLPKDDLKALDCWIRAAELGSAQACGCIATCYEKGNGIAANKESPQFFNRLGALRGSIISRHNIGNSECNTGNHEVGIRHWKIAAEGGSQPSIDMLKKIYNANGKHPGKELISKKCLDSLYRVCHDAQEEVRSEEREKHCTDNNAAANMKC